MRAGTGAAIGVVLFLASFAVYLRTLSPSITWANYGADSGDLATAAYVLGIAHPSGYPTYVLVGKLFTLVVPFGEVAYRLNLMSAFFAALASVFVYPIVLELIPLAFGGKKRGAESLTAAIVASLSLAFSPVLWSQATIAEVYALNAFFVAAVCYVALRWWRGGPAWLLPLGAFLLGLGAGNHPSLLLIIPGALFLLLQKRTAIGGWKGLGAIVLSLLLGLCVYVLLPLRANAAPSLTWDDASTLPGFINTVFAAPYRRYFLTLPVQYLPQRISALSAFLAQQFNWLGLALGLLGAAALWQRERPFAVFTFAFFVLTAAYATLYNTVDSYVYLIPGFLLLAVWLGLGAMALAHWLREARCQWERWQGKPGAGFPFLLPVPTPSRSRCVGTSRFPLLLLLAIPGLSLVGNFSTLDLSGNTAARDYAAEVFRSVEPNALLIADTDAHVTSLWYYRNVLAPDSQVTVVVKELLPYDAYLQDLLRRDLSLVAPPTTGDRTARVASLIRANLERRPIYLTGPEPLIQRSFSTRQIGTLYRVEAGQERPS